MSLVSYENLSLHSKLFLSWFPGKEIGTTHVFQLFCKTKPRMLYYMVNYEQGFTVIWPTTVVISPAFAMCRCLYRYSVASVPIHESLFVKLFSHISFQTISQLESKIIQNVYKVIGFNVYSYLACKLSERCIMNANLYPVKHTITINAKVLFT